VAILRGCTPKAAGALDACPWSLATAQDSGLVGFIAIEEE
jgi:hypothetical protein